MGTICPKEKKKKTVELADPHRTINKIDLESHSHVKIMPKMQKGETGSQAESMMKISETNFMGRLAEKLKTPQESKQMEAYIKMDDQGSEIYGYKKGRSDVDGPLSVRSQVKSKYGANFVLSNDFFTTEDPIYKNDYLEILQCFNRSTGKLYTLKVVTVY